MGPSPTRRTPEAPTRRSGARPPITHWCLVGSTGPIRVRQMVETDLQHLRKRRTARSDLVARSNTLVDGDPVRRATPPARSTPWDRRAPFHGPSLGLVTGGTFGPLEPALRPASTQRFPVDTRCMDDPVHGNDPVGINTAGVLLRVHASSNAIVSVLMRELDLTKEEADAAVCAALERASRETARH
jgi:hypothetical protein